MDGNMFCDSSLIKQFINEAEDIRCYPELARPKAGKKCVFLSASGTNQVLIVVEVACF